MKKLTITLEDESLIRAMEEEAKFTGCTVEDIAIRALQFWQVETELDAEEKEEIDKAREEWKKNGGQEAKAFFDSLREEENASES